MEINLVHDFINDLLRKEQKGYQDPEQIDTALNRGQMRVFNTYRSVYASDNEAKEALAPFVKKLQYGTQADGTYQVDAAQEFQGLTGLEIQYLENGRKRYKEVSFPDEDEFGSRLGSQLLEPTLTDPIGEVIGFGKYQLHPAGVYAGTIRFLKKPQDVKFAYTESGRTISYDASKSKQLEWADKYVDKVILAALTYLGINLGDGEILQISEALSKLK